MLLYKINKFSPVVKHFQPGDRAQLKKNDVSMWRGNPRNRLTRVAAEVRSPGPANVKAGGMRDRWSYFRFLLESDHGKSGMSDGDLAGPTPFPKGSQSCLRSRWVQHVKSIILIQIYWKCNLQFILTNLYTLLKSVFAWDTFLDHKSLYAVQLSIDEGLDLP